MNFDHTYDEDGDIIKTSHEHWCRCHVCEYDIDTLLIAWNASEKLGSPEWFVRMANLLDEMKVGSPQYNAIMDQIIEEEERT